MTDLRAEGLRSNSYAHALYNYVLSLSSQACIYTLRLIIIGLQFILEPLLILYHYDCGRQKEDRTIAAFEYNATTHRRRTTGSADCEKDLIMLQKKKKKPF